MTSTLVRRLRHVALGVAAASILFVPTLAAQRAGSRPLQAADAHRALGLAGGELLSLPVDRTPGVPVTLPLSLDGQPAILALTPHSLRAPGYRLLVEGPDGSFATARPSGTRTLRGELMGVSGSSAAASMLDDGLHVRIRMPDGRDVWIEPLLGRVAGASATQYIVYRGEDVLDQGRVCGTEALPDAMLHAGTVKVADGGTQAATGLKVAQLACDADYEYLQDWGSVTAVENRIHSVINTVNLQYESDVGITHEITTILVRTSSSQPYTSTDASTLLNQFRSQWNASHGNITRDVAQLFTGKTIAGSTIGIAWVGVVCNLSYAYGVVESDFNSNFAYATDLSAHELGHNWGASHCTCTSYTMNPYITAANAFNPVGTIPTITAFRDSASCLTDGGGDPPPPDPGTNLATADFSTGNGSISSGSYLSTHASDDVYEALTEGHTGGNPKNRKSLLEHRWTFAVSAGTAYTFSVEAHHSPNAENDHFRFRYSRDQSTWTTMLTVTKTADNGTAQSYAFPEDVSGTLYVRVEDTDQTAGKHSTDTVFVDRMVVTTTSGGPDLTPPATPTGLEAGAASGSVTLDWDDLADADLAGYTVRRSTLDGGPYAPLTGLIANSTYVDSAVSNGTTYFYVVTATDGSGNTSDQSDQVSATPDVPGAGPTTMHVQQIVVSTQNAAAGYKYGVAQVLIRDEDGGAVAGATVTGTFSGGISQTVSATTNASGLAVLSTTSTAKGGFPLTLCVVSLTHGTLTHQPADDAQTCGSK
jgi:hypothetical protein